MKTEIVVATSGVITSLIAIIASYFIGVRTGRVNEKRKEWNALVELVLVILEAQLRAYERGSLTKYDHRNYDFPYDKIEAIRRRLKGRSLTKFNSAFADYHSAKTKLADGPVRQYEEARKAIKPVMQILKLR